MQECMVRALFFYHAILLATLKGYSEESPKNKKWLCKLFLRKLLLMEMEIHYADLSGERR